MDEKDRRASPRQAGSYYAQAAALLRQEMETIAALGEMKSAKRKDGKVPQVGGLPWGLKTLYGSLSALTHVWNNEVLTGLYSMEPMGEARPASMVPLYNRDTARRMYGTHVAFLIGASLELAVLHEDMYRANPTIDEQGLILSAFDALREEGYFVYAHEDGAPAPAEPPHWPERRTAGIQT